MQPNRELLTKPNRELLDEFTGDQVQSLLCLLVGGAWIQWGLTGFRGSTWRGVCKKVV